MLFDEMSSNICSPTIDRQKLAEVDALMRKVQGMKMILAKGLNCHCTNLEECIDCIIRAEASS